MPLGDDGVVPVPCSGGTIELSAELRTGAAGEISTRASNRHELRSRSASRVSRADSVLSRAGTASEGVSWRGGDSP